MEGNYGDYIISAIMCDTCNNSAVYTLITKPLPLRQVFKYCSECIIIAKKELDKKNK